MIFCNVPVITVICRATLHKLMALLQSLKVKHSFQKAKNVGNWPVLLSDRAQGQIKQLIIPNCHNMEEAYWYLKSLLKYLSLKNGPSCSRENQDGFPCQSRFLCPSLEFKYSYVCLMVLILRDNRQSDISCSKCLLMVFSHFSILKQRKLWKCQLLVLLSKYIN